MTFKEFREKVPLTREDIYKEIFSRYRGSIKVKKEKTALKNIELIYEAALKISNQKSFAIMTVRDLSRETGLSVGVLYHYFAGKDELLDMVQSTGRSLAKRALIWAMESAPDPAAKLRTVVEAHVFISEIMQPWFYFSYMEARNLGELQKRRAMQSELETEEIIAQIIEGGREAGVFQVADSRLMASALKAVLQDWYIKRWKYLKRGQDVDQFAKFAVEIAEKCCLAGG